MRQSVTLADLRIVHLAMSASIGGPAADRDDYADDIGDDCSDEVKLHAPQRALHPNRLVPSRTRASVKRAGFSQKATVATWRNVSSKRWGM